MAVAKRYKQKSKYLCNNNIVFEAKRNREVKNLPMKTTVFVKLFRILKMIFNYSGQKFSLQTRDLFLRRNELFIRIIKDVANYFGRTCIPVAIRFY